MARRSRATIQELRTAIDVLPRRTKIAMLDGIRSNEIIVGAYTDGRGGICPMLAAHRAGGRTDYIGFARAWDRFGSPAERGRRATTRELLILRTHLEASLLDEETPSSDLAKAMAEHRKLIARSRPTETSQPPVRRPSRHERTAAIRPGDRDRSRELRGRPGWAWLRVFRRYDDYRRALARVESEHRALRKESSDGERALGQP